jgi:hypothetical protein
MDAGAAEGGAARRIERARAALLILGAAVWLAVAGGVAAEAEWCDDGSPPPNDFRLQQTDSSSAGSSPAWLSSTTNGDALLATYATTGQVDVSQVGQLSGGVADGMTTAVSSTSTADAAR